MKQYLKRKSGKFNPTLEDLKRIDIKIDDLREAYPDLASCYLDRYQMKSARNAWIDGLFSGKNQEVKNLKLTAVKNLPRLPVRGPVTPAASLVTPAASPAASALPSPAASALPSPAASFTPATHIASPVTPITPVSPATRGPKSSTGRLRVATATASAKAKEAVDSIKTEPLDLSETPPNRAITLESMMNKYEDNITIELVEELCTQINNTSSIRALTNMCSMLYMIDLNRYNYSMDPSQVVEQILTIEDTLDTNRSDADENSNIYHISSLLLLFINTHKVGSYLTSIDISRQEDISTKMGRYINNWQDLFLKILCDDFNKSDNDNYLHNVCLLFFMIYNNNQDNDETIRYIVDYIDYIKDKLNIILSVSDNDNLKLVAQELLRLLAASA